MKSELLSAVEIEPEAPARSAVIWLHGLGADGHDFEPIVPELGLDPDLRTRFVFPHAPCIPVTINLGMVMPAWYDIRDANLGDRADLPGLRRSVAQVAHLLAREGERGVPSHRIVLAGFSQGGAVALHLALRHPERLAGVLALSTYLVDEESLAREAHPANAGLPIFQTHGTLDPMVPAGWGARARERFRELGYAVTWKTYPMMHAVCPEEIADIGRWLNSVLKEK
jgi:phospholipase/carboxylesterase